MNPTTKPSTAGPCTTGRDWHDGNHPGYTLATWLKTYADQVWHFAIHLNVDWTSNAAERGVKPGKRHQAIPGYGKPTTPLNRWRLINSYLTTTRNHGLTALEAITRTLTADPGYHGRPQRNQTSSRHQPVNGHAGYGCLHASSRVSPFILVF